MKICKTCNEENSLDCFYIRKDSGKYRNECKECWSKRKKLKYPENKDKIKNKHKEYYEKNRDKVKKTVKKYADKNKDKIAEKSKVYREENKETISVKKKKYVEENADKIAEYQRQYREKNADVLREKARVFRAKRRQEDVGYRILQNCRKRIYDALNGKCKSKRTIELLGCSVEEYKDYLKSKFQEGMSWENYSRGGWNIDHIRPCASFDFSDSKQQKECFRYENTQPLWEDENIRKSDSFIISG